MFLNLENTVEILWINKEILTVTVILRICIRIRHEIFENLGRVENCK